VINNERRYDVFLCIEPQISLLSLFYFVIKK
jgi:hypothetical protein